MKNLTVVFSALLFAGCAAKYNTHKDGVSEMQMEADQQYCMARGRAAMAGVQPTPVEPRYTCNSGGCYDSSGSAALGAAIGNIGRQRAVGTSVALACMRDLGYTVTKRK